MDRRYILMVQGGYYVLTGLWAIFSIGTFQRITGPKVDTWLVKTVGALVLVSGGVMLASGSRRRQPPETHLLAAGSALAFMAIDAVYVAKRRISPVYLLDFVAEALLLLGLARPPRRDA